MLLRRVIGAERQPRRPPRRPHRPAGSARCPEMAYERQDAVYRRAKREGYRSRAAYKLIELDKHYRLLRPGARVVDLGCWPGAWLQVAAERVGARGRVVGVDVVPAEELGLANVSVLAGDVSDPALIERVRAALGGPADVVLVDVAPKLTGIKAADSARQADLIRAAIGCAQAWLKPGGTMLIKLFMDAEYPDLIRELRARFGEVRTRRPESTRRGSAELYAVARHQRDTGVETA